MPTLEQLMARGKNVKTKKGSGSKSSRDLFQCPLCSELLTVSESAPKRVYFHTAKPEESNCKIFTLDEFKGKSCFDIYHSAKANGLWSKSTGNTQTSHPLYKKLEALWNNPE